MSGITIQDTQIRSISGPVSVFFLRPKPHIYKDGNASNFPLIMLFGDAHQSTERMCNDCTCDQSKNDAGKCCYKIYDPSFLQLLDTLADDKHPVDFYTETFQHGTHSENPRPPMAKLASDMKFVTCYQRNLRGTSAYRKYCPTRYIRWHGGDSRQSGSIFGRGTIYENLPGEIKREDIILTKRYIQNLNIESQLYYLLHFALNVDKTRASLFINQTILETYANLERFLISSIENPESFAQELFSMMTYKNSVIYKQIMKQNYPGFRTVNDWAKLYAQNLVNLRRQSFCIAYYYGSEAITKEKFFLDKMSQTYHLKKILDDINSALMDIYFISRMLKQPSGGIRSSLTFGYFGHAHILNVVRLLHQINVYDLVYFKNMTQLVDGHPSRCKIIDFSLDLSAEVRLHNQAVDRENLKNPKNL
uniref:Uncharacterized protein n=1 Tax=viral metagenome TaxID=1070528 RepID=A0A6C0KDW4_9ZZZZ